LTTAVMERPASSTRVERPSVAKEPLIKFYHKGLVSGLKIGFHHFDDLYSVTKGQLTVITGIPTHGKSEWMDMMMVRMVLRHGWKFLVFSPENFPFEYHLEKLITKFYKAGFHDRSQKRVTEEQIKRILPFLDKHFIFINQDEDGATLEQILDIAREAKEVDGLLIDPWNEVDHQRSREFSETEYIGKSLAMVRRFARSHKKAVWIVAHPKMLLKDSRTGAVPVPTAYDISGSAHWYNKADNIITVYLAGDCVELHVQKIKFKFNGKKGVAKVRYDDLTGEYIELHEQ